MSQRDSPYSPHTQKLLAKFKKNKHTKGRRPATGKDATAFRKEAMNAIAPFIKDWVPLKNFRQPLLQVVKVHYKGAARADLTNKLDVLVRKKLIQVKCVDDASSGKQRRYKIGPAHAADAPTGKMTAAPAPSEDRAHDPRVEGAAAARALLEGSMQALAHRFAQGYVLEEWFATLEGLVEEECDEEDRDAAGEMLDYLPDDYFDDEEHRTMHLVIKHGVCYAEGRFWLDTDAVARNLGSDWVARLLRLCEERDCGFGTEYGALLDAMRAVA